LCLLISPAISNADFAVGQRGVFEHPRISGAIVDWCVSWGTNCGQAAADNFCRTQGYRRSIGYLTYAPGRTNVAGAICESPYCGGFSRVECDQGVPGQGGAAAQTGSGGTTLLCQFTEGPLAGRIIDYSGHAGATPAVIGQRCSDGSTSSGIAIAAGSAAVRGAAAQTGSGGTTLLCQFTEGPLAGRIIDYSGHAGAIPAVIGQRCSDGSTSSGIAIAAGSAGVRGAAVPDNNSPVPPVASAGAPRSGSGEQGNTDSGSHYPFPQMNGVAIDGCARYAEDCGQGSADQFCRTQGFASASRWNWAYDQRTWVIGSNRYCETGPGVNCGGLRDVVCTGRAHSR
jgi:hypothetical protein